MNLRQVAWEATAGHRKKGAKKYRHLQCTRLLKFVAFAQKRGARDFGQIGKRTFISFCKEHKLSTKTAKEYRKIISFFNQLVDGKIHI